MDRLSYCKYFITVSH